MKKTNFWSKVNFEIEEVILTIIILLNLFDGFNLLSSEGDYIKKIISWTALGILFYKLDLNTIFSGNSNKRINILLIIGFFSLTIKNVVSYAISTKNITSNFLKPLFTVIIDNAAKIEITGIYVGLIFILFASIYFAVLQNIKTPSILCFLKKNNFDSKNIFFKNKLIKIILFFSVSMLFFVSIFNLIMEWLAISIDAPLVIIGVFTYFLFVIKHKEKFKTNSFLFKFGNFGNKFYLQVINNLKVKEKSILILGGVLSLHLITDLLIFIWSYIFNVNNKLYLINSSSIFMNLINNILMENVFTKIFTIGIYFLNIVGIIFLLLMPFYIWLLLFYNREIKLNLTFKKLFFSSLITFIMFPIFKFTRIINSNFAGINIETNLILFDNFYIKIFVLTILIILFNIYSRKLEQQSTKLIFLISNLFFVSYILNYALSILTNYFNLTYIALSISNIILLIFFMSLFLFNIIFYTLGLLNYQVNLIKKISM